MAGMHMLCDEAYPSSAPERLQLDEPLYVLPRRKHGSESRLGKTGINVC